MFDAQLGLAGYTYILSKALCGIIALGTLASYVTGHLDALPADRAHMLGRGVGGVLTMLTISYYTQHSHADDQLVGETATFPLDTLLDRRTHELLLPLYPPPPELQRSHSWREAVSTYTDALLLHLPILSAVVHALHSDRAAQTPGRRSRPSPRQNARGGLGVLRVTLTLADR